MTSEQYQTKRQDIIDNFKSLSIEQILSNPITTTILEMMIRDTDPYEIIEILIKQQEAVHADMLHLIGTMPVRRVICDLCTNRITAGKRNAVGFNEKELKTLQLLANDKSTTEIAKELYLSPRTIETIRGNIKKKVGASTTAGLIAYAIRNTIIK